MIAFLAGVKAWIACAVTDLPTQTAKKHKFYVKALDEK